MVQTRSSTTIGSKREHEFNGSRRETENERAHTIEVAPAVECIPCREIVRVAEADACKDEEEAGEDPLCVRS